MMKSRPQWISMVEPHSLVILVLLIQLIGLSL